MDIRSLKSLNSRKGSYPSISQYYVKDLKKEFFLLVFKAISSFFKDGLVLGDEEKSSDGNIVTLIGRVKTSAMMRPAMNRIRTIKWLRMSNFSYSKNSCKAILTLNPSAFKKQLNAIQDKKKQEIAVGGMYYVKIGIHLLPGKNAAGGLKGSSLIHQKKGKPITASSFTVKDFHIRQKMKYSLNVLLKEVYSGLSAYPSASAFISGILNRAENLSDRGFIMKTTLTAMQLKTIQSNFLPIAAAVSALAANPKSTVMFIPSGFVLFKRNDPIGRFGSSIKEKLLKNLFEKCRKECGSIPGNTQAIMDVLDAEGKPIEKRLKEVFNDFSKHIYTNSSGPAAQAALKIKYVARITAGRMDWNIFKKSFDDAAKRVKEIEYDPMMDEMKKTAIDLNRGRGVINPATMDWMKTFEKKDLKWLGTLAADILEEEVNQRSSARTSLSCVANWKENMIDCKLSINHIGSEGERAILSPCKKFYTGRWKIELQGIMKGKAGWSKSR